MDFQVFLPIEKIDEEKRMVWGYASTPTKDLQGEIVTLDAIKAALPDYMQWRNIREMHTASAVGSAVEAHVNENGLYIGAKIRDNNAWEKCKESKKGANDQVYRGFSIGGSKLEKLGDTIKRLQLTEISLVDRPANPDCRIDCAKAAGLETSSPEAQNRTSLFGKFLDVCKSFGFGDGFSAPAHVLEQPTHAAAEGHTAQVILPPKWNLDPHLSSALQQELRKPGSVTPAVEMSEEELKALENKFVTVDFAKREFSEKERKHLASQGLALPDGSFPIASEQDLHNAIQAFGRAGDKPEAKAHIVSRAKAMKLTHLLPADWPGSTKEEKTVMNSDLQKRISAAHKGHIDKAISHLKKAAECHGKACGAFNNLHKCMGKAAGEDTEKLTHMKTLHSALSSMSDHHDIALHHLGAAKSSWTGEHAETPKEGEGGDVSAPNTEAIELLPPSHVSEGTVDGSSFMGAGDSPYSAAALAAEIQKQVAAVAKPLQDKLHEVELENATMKGQMSVIECMPAGGPRPRLFNGGTDSTTLSMLTGTDNKAAVNTEIAKSYQSIDPNDPESATRAAARIIGLRAQNPGLFAKRITDPEYRGGAGR